MEQGGDNIAHDGSSQSIAVSSIGGDEGRFDTGLQVDGSDSRGIAAWRRG
jgi:hypothetical protein